MCDPVSCEAQPASAMRGYIKQRVNRKGDGSKEKAIIEERSKRKPKPKGRRASTREGELTGERIRGVREPGGEGSAHICDATVIRSERRYCQYEGMAGIGWENSDCAVRDS